MQPFEIMFIKSCLKGRPNTVYRLMGMTKLVTADYIYLNYAL